MRFWEWDIITGCSNIQELQKLAWYTVGQNISLWSNNKNHQMMTIIIFKLFAQSSSCLHANWQNLPSFPSLPVQYCTEGDRTGLYPRSKERGYRLSYNISHLFGTKNKSRGYCGLIGHSTCYHAIVCSAWKLLRMEGGMKEEWKKEEG